MAIVSAAPRRHAVSQAIGLRDDMVLNSIIQQATAGDTVLHIGPGVLYENINYKMARARLYIIEPDAYRAHLLKNALRCKQNVKIIEKGLASESDSAIYHKLSFGVLNSMRAADGLEKLFPGIALQDAQEVSPISTDEILSLLPAAHRSHDILVVDALGEALNLLRAFEDAAALSRFDHIVIRAMREPVFAGAALLQEISEWLEERRYARPVLIDSSDPDFPITYFKKNELAEALEALSEELQAAVRKSLVVGNDLNDLQAQLAQLRAEKEEQEKLFPQVAERFSEALEFLRRLADSADFDANDAQLRSLLGGGDGGEIARGDGEAKSSSD